MEKDYFDWKKAGKITEEFIAAAGLFAIALYEWNKDKTKTRQAKEFLDSVRQREALIPVPIKEYSKEDVIQAFDEHGIYCPITYHPDTCEPLLWVRTCDLQFDKERGDSVFNQIMNEVKESSLNVTRIYNPNDFHRINKGLPVFSIDNLSEYQIANLPKFAKKMYREGQGDISMSFTVDNGIVYLCPKGKNVSMDELDRKVTNIKHRLALLTVGEKGKMMEEDFNTKSSEMTKIFGKKSRENSMRKIGLIENMFNDKTAQGSFCIVNAEKYDAVHNEKPLRCIRVTKDKVTYCNGVDCVEYGPFNNVDDILSTVHNLMDNIDYPVVTNEIINKSENDLENEIFNKYHCEDYKSLSDGEVYALQAIELKISNPNAVPKQEKLSKEEEQSRDEVIREFQETSESIKINTGNVNDIEFSTKNLESTIAGYEGDGRISFNPGANSYDSVL